MAHCMLPRLCLIVALAISSAVSFDRTTPWQPQLQHLTHATTRGSTDSLIITSADSATILSPPLRTNCNEREATFAIDPKLPTDSVTLFVRYANNTTDTLCRLHKPPYKATWNYTNIPDQDQLHLSFGYTLYLPGNREIHSGALPHRWIIDRKNSLCRKKAHCFPKPKNSPITIDGSLEDWKHSKRQKIGSRGTFSLLWTDDTLFFSAEVFDTAVTPHNFIELHLDPLNRKESFAGSSYRDIRFGPKTRSYCLVTNLTPNGFTRNDSIAVLLTQGMLWRSAVASKSYTIEAAIPFYALSDLGFPLLVSGFDVAITAQNHNSSDRAFVSWSNTSEFTAYNPSEWGSIVLHQPFLPLKIAIILAAFFFGSALIVTISIQIRHFYLNNQHSNLAAKPESPHLRIVHDAIIRAIADPTLKLEHIAASTGLRSDHITATLKKEIESTFEQYLNFQRVNRAKQLLRSNDLPPETIALQCGFVSPEEFNKQFHTFSQCYPLEYRANLSNEEDDEDSA